ncbi:MAG: MarR family transcriptional regulator [Gimesia sp.]|nr:MarR family transcriptional regulator [Gimesia sp.]
MSAEEISILTVLAHLDEPEQMKPLAEMLGRDATTVSRQISVLEKTGLVERYQHPEDVRSTVVSATKAGIKLVEKTLPLTITLRTQAMKEISSADANALVRGLSQMLKNLRTDE